VNATHRIEPLARVPGLTDPAAGAHVTSGTTGNDLAALPHERDERTGHPAIPTLPMRLAAEDLAEGRVDTDCRGSSAANECPRDVGALLRPAPRVKRVR
jgi:hypothetical protein